MREPGYDEIFANDNTKAQSGSESVTITASDLNNGITPDYREGAVIAVTGPDMLNTGGWRNIRHNFKIPFNLVLDNGQTEIEKDALFKL
jgi:hypothetical protein